MDQIMHEVSYFNHRKALKKISSKKGTLSMRVFRKKKSWGSSKDPIFKTGGHFRIMGQYVNDDEYFDKAHKMNILLAKRIQAIENRKPSIILKPQSNYKIIIYTLPRWSINTINYHYIWNALPNLINYKLYSLF